MSGTACQTFNHLLVPLAAIVCGVWQLQLGVIEVYLLWAFSILSVAAHVHYGICVVIVNNFVCCVVVSIYFSATSC